MSAGILSAAAVAHAERFPFVCDDAYISLRYAENLAHHGQLVWNLGERVEGYTNFLWTVFLAGVHRLGMALPTAALFFGRLFAAGAVVLLLFLGARLSDRAGESPRAIPWLTLLAPGLTAGTAAFAVWGSGGLEVGMFVFLLTGALYALLGEEDCHRIFQPSILLLALAAMTRPDGLLFAGAMGLPKAWQWIEAAVRRRVRPARALAGLAAWVAVLVGLYGAYFLWRYHYYGYLFPNTYYIKTTGAGSPPVLKEGAAYVRSFVRYYHLVWALPFLAVGLARAVVLASKGRWTHLRFQVYALTSLAVLSAYTIYVGGDFMAMHRFLVPAVPLLALLAQEGVWALATLPTARRWMQAAALVLSALLVASWAQNSKRLGDKTLHTLKVTKTGYSGAYDGMESVAYMKKFAEDRLRIGYWLRKRVPKGSLMAVGGAGAIVFASGLRAIDSFGLSDLYVAHHTKPVSTRPGHQKRAPMSYILSRHPDIVCAPFAVRFQDWEYRPSPAERARWERRGYEFFCATPKGLHPSHYCCLKRIDKDLGLQPVSAYRF